MNFSAGGGANLGAQSSCSRAMVSSAEAEISERHSVEILDAEQLGARLSELLLDGAQRARIDVARVQLDFGHEPVEDLVLDKAEIADSEADRVIVRAGVAKSSEELLASRQHPPPFGGDQHRQLFHQRLRTVTRPGGNAPSRTNSPSAP
jgi:hypothetical protein